jgi:hypothetical protein
MLHFLYSQVDEDIFQGLGLRFESRSLEMALWTYVHVLFLGRSRVNSRKTLCNDWSRWVVSA